MEGWRDGGIERWRDCVYVYAFGGARKIVRE